ncbi:MAG: sigma 54-interacting transcriptional regulator [Gemmatimonadales bacterium]|nr:sigma 54-interacting transcriptional regulator [Gemmatimonadales bacterium]
MDWALNCAAIPAELIESELFGHEKGSFTGATTLKHGAFEQARGGTLLLDELGDSPPALQAKLLRTLEEYAFRRVGGSVAIQADVRIVAATSFDIERLALEGGMRKELYYRLNVVRIHLPPLCDRPDDILRLARHFLVRFADRLGKQIRGFSPAAEMILLARGWPGNIRELRNAVERGVILSEGELVDAPCLAGNPGLTVTSAKLYEEAKDLVLLQFKREYLSARLVETAGSVTKAAELSGLKRQSFSRMCTEAGVDPGKFVSRREI